LTVYDRTLNVIRATGYQMWRNNYWRENSNRVYSIDSNFSQFDEKIKSFALKMKFAYLIVSDPKFITPSEPFILFGLETTPELMHQARGRLNTKKFGI